MVVVCNCSGLKGAVLGVLGCLCFSNLVDFGLRFDFCDAIMLCSVFGVLIAIFSCRFSLA